MHHASRNGSASTSTSYTRQTTASSSLSALYPIDLPVPAIPDLPPPQPRAQSFVPGSKASVAAAMRDWEIAGGADPVVLNTVSTAEDG
eukprot:1964686-Rhodomonas_salina.1